MEANRTPAAPVEKSPFTAEDREANRRYFEAKLRAEKPINDVVSKVQGKSTGDFLLLDTRGRDAYAKAHVPGALCVPLDEIPRLAESLPRDKELVTYCWNDTWHLSAKAALQLAERGFFVKELNAGWAEWEERKLPTESGRAVQGGMLPAPPV